eukprot:CAMPEP_0117445956 /NCGR_PEP_ID=MMETSP0759-20121206/6076_1 /TAXON_ID=63605 /ORGANISM="Percolomonas cosmopolitus, Strain WS" /LENGTH=569 /DNA_ID=CAMNT_0005238175 /DNA_START=69 /DNA_END=1778 /DNA_ORIENTATION=-
MTVQDQDSNSSLSSPTAATTTTTNHVVPNTTESSPRKRKRSSSSESDTFSEPKNKNSDGGGARKRSRTRKNNVKHACVACKQRHVRCDDAKPCHHCVKRQTDCRIQVFVADDNGELKETFQVFSWDGRLQNGKLRAGHSQGDGANANSTDAEPHQQHAPSVVPSPALRIHQSFPVKQSSTALPSSTTPAAGVPISMASQHQQQPNQSFPYQSSNFSMVQNGQQHSQMIHQPHMHQLHADHSHTQSHTHSSYPAQHASSQSPTTPSLVPIDPNLLLSGQSLDLDESFFPPPFGLLSPGNDAPGEGLFTDVLQQQEQNNPKSNQQGNRSHPGSSSPDSDLFSALSSTVQHQSTIIKSLMSHIDQLTRAMHEQRQQHENQMKSLASQSSFHSARPHPSTYMNPFTEAYATDVPACLIALPSNQFQAKLLLWNEAYLQLVGSKESALMQAEIPIDISNFYNVCDHLRHTSNGLLRILMSRYYSNTVPILSGSRILRLCGQLLRAKWKISHAGGGVSLVFASYTPVDVFDDTIEVNGLRFEATMTLPDHERLNEEQLFSLHRREMQALDYLNNR